MNKIRGNLLVKIIAVLLLTAFAAVFALSLVGFAALYSYGAYTKGYESAREELLENIGWHMTTDAGHKYLNCYEPEGIQKDTDFRFAVYRHGEDKPLYSNYRGEKSLWNSDDVLIYNPYSVVEAPVPTPAPTLTPVPVPIPTGSLPAETLPAETLPAKTLPADTLPADTLPAETLPAVEHDGYYTVKGYILAGDKYPNDNISIALGLFEKGFALRYELIALCAGAALLALACLIFLFCAAGHRRGIEAITPNFIDKIPYDVFFLADGALVMGAAVLGFAGFNTRDIAVTVLGCVCCLAAFELLLLFMLSTATRIKLRNLIKNTLCFKVFAWAWALLKKLFSALFGLLKAVPFVRKGVIIYAALLAVEFIWLLMADRDLGMHAFGWLFERCVFGVLLVYALLCVKKLRAGAAALASGDEGQRISTEKMYGEFKAHADDLNNIGEGIVKAVDERMKSERFKTELITNVSHDIKTPLTSIINYVDLMEKEEPENEKMREYIEVLSRQSARLKKLIEDLMEASKASTGNLAVNFERCALGVLLAQTAGEYGEKLEGRGLELVLTKPEEEVFIRADGRHMWRIFDNLMSNILKYAQPGTRVYLSLERRGEKALVTFRNISQSRLNISGEELMERFVRGDSSRSTEGSGLGLSIAKSLVQLQKGEMELSVDGDLFKISLIFDAI